MDRRERLNDLPEAVLAAFQGFQSELWTALPGQILSFDAAKMTVSVQCTLKMQQRKPDGSWVWVTIPPLVDCPVMFPGGGGFTLTFPVAAGDECLVVFASRCIDSWWQLGGAQVQAEFRMHDLSDGFAFVGVRSVPRALSAVSTSNVQLRSDDGLAFVQITPGHDIRAETTTTIHAKAGSDAFVEAAGKIQLKAPLVEIIGDVTVTGSITSGGDMVADGISLDHHVHTGVQSGGSLSGGPQ